MMRVVETIEKAADIANKWREGVYSHAAARMMLADLGMYGISGVEWKATATTNWRAIAYFNGVRFEL